MESVGRYVDWTSAGLAVLATLISILLLEIFRMNSFRNIYPPGPRPLPFIGNMHLTMRNPMSNIKALAKYGDMCTMFLGRTPAIVLNNLQTTKEVFVQNGAISSARQNQPFVLWLNKAYGILHSSGNSWKEQRRFSLHMMRNFGLGRKTVEERVIEESGFLIKEMIKHQGKPFYPIHPLMNAVSNIICSIVFGDRFNYDDEHFRKMLKTLNENVQIPGSAFAQIFNVFPILRYLPGPHQKIRRKALDMEKFIRDAVEEHRRTLDPENPRDYIDAYLVEMSKQETNNDSSFNEDNMMKSISDLFIAGTETTANTLRWGIIYMMKHPEVQERCHEEIVGVLGYDRTATMDDRVRLPYTYATIHEIQRLASLAPLCVPHKLLEPIKLQGYNIPSGALITSNFTAIMTDKEHWKYPDTFNPDNFLDDNGQFCKQESFVAFSLGPRVCPGEALARTELFIFYTSLLQHLHFSWPPGAPPYNMEGTMGTIHFPFPFHTICRSRKAAH